MHKTLKRMHDIKVKYENQGFKMDETTLKKNAWEKFLSLNRNKIRMHGH